MTIDLLRSRNISTIRRMDLSEDMQRQAKALADPSRFRLMRHIATATAPVSVAELTDLLGFNHNAIRQHLAILNETGLVAETTERRTAPGRPRKMYTVRADALSAFRSASGSYERLAALLLNVITTGRSPFDVGYKSAFLAVAEEPPPATTSEAFQELLSRLTVDGFEPVQRDVSSAELMHCPFADVAAEDQTIVCELHRGLIDGHLAGRDAALTGDLNPRNPHEAGCEVTVRMRAHPAP